MELILLIFLVILLFGGGFGYYRGGYYGRGGGWHRRRARARPHRAADRVAGARPFWLNRGSPRPRRREGHEPDLTRINAFGVFSRR
jgi:hypothetical protein